MKSLAHNLKTKEFGIVLLDYRMDYNHRDYGEETVSEEVSEELVLTKTRLQPNVRLEKVQPSIDKTLE